MDVRMRKCAGMVPLLVGGLMSSLGGRGGGGSVSRVALMLRPRVGVPVADKVVGVLQRHNVNCQNLYSDCTFGLRPQSTCAN